MARKEEADEGSSGNGSDRYSPPEPDMDDEVGTGLLRERVKVEPMDGKDLAEFADRLTAIAYELMGWSLRLRKSSELW